METRHDAIVIGLGGMGSAAAYELARRGLRVLGVDRHSPAHDRGSSHGRSRIIRQAYFEDPAYVPLLLRSWELWRRLEADRGRALLRVTGGLMIGNQDSEVFAGSLRSARRHGLAHRVFDAAELRRRFPPLVPGPDTVALFEELAGTVAPEKSVRTFLDAAADAGAELVHGSIARGWQADDGVTVQTDSCTHRAETLVIAAGAWAPELLGADGLRVTRELMFWLQPPAGVRPFLPDRFPVWLWEAPDGGVVYGFPALDGADGGVKVAVHHGGDETDPDAIDRRVHPEDEARLRELLAPRIPGLDGPVLDAAVCMYTNTPRHHFVLGRHPAHDDVLVAAGFSGHGYKFAPVVGEILADLATRGHTELPIEPFDPGRLL